jgi:hypothetical protein
LKNSFCMSIMSKAGFIFCSPSLLHYPTVFVSFGTDDR